MTHVVAPMPHPTKVAIIGGGPAGLMAAEQLASKGITVTVYERMPTVGRKFMMAGRGGLNLTHSESLDSLISRYGAASEWLKPVLESYPPQAVRDWCEGLGQKTFVGTSGRVFPESLKASPLLRAWLRRLDSLGVCFVLRHSWKGWDQKGNLIFADAEGATIALRADAVILALGGASWPRLGSNGRWTNILSTQGISIKPLRPTNCGFIVPWSEVFSRKFAGVPLKPIKISFDGKSLQGEAMVTREGLEGGVIYAFSAVLRDAIEAGGEAVLRLDLHPGLSEEELTKRLGAARGSRSLSTHLRKAVGLPPVAIALMRESLYGASLPADVGLLAELIKGTRINFTATAAIDRAISCAGGIGRNEVNTNFMLKKKTGVFAIGEMLDWEAPTGGYLLQACFSTAVAAAQGIIHYLESARDFSL